MATFTDNKEQQWEVKIDAPAILRVRSECDPNFLLNDTDTDNTYNRLRNDYALLCTVIYVLCEKQRNDRNVSMEDFYDGLVGDAIDSATEAVLEAIVFFSPKSDREWMKASVAKQNKWRELGLAKALARINDPKTEEKLLATMDEMLAFDIERVMTLRESVTASPDSSESAPTD